MVIFFLQFSYKTITFAGSQQLGVAQTKAISGLWHALQLVQTMDQASAFQLLLIWKWGHTSATMQPHQDTGRHFFYENSTIMKIYGK